MLPYPNDRTFSDAVDKHAQENREQLKTGREPDPALLRKLLGEIRGMDFGPESRPDWSRKDD